MTAYLTSPPNTIFSANLFLIVTVLLFVCTLYIILAFSYFLKGWAVQFFVCTPLPSTREEAYYFWMLLKIICIFNFQIFFAILLNSFIRLFLLHVIDIFIFFPSLMTVSLTLQQFIFISFWFAIFSSTNRSFP